MKEDNNKFCSKCGTKLPTGAEFCPKCGKPVPKSIRHESKDSEAISDTNDKVVVEQTAEANHETTSKLKSGPVGVGGWLTLFLITALGSAVIMVIDIFQTVPSINGNGAVLLLPLVALEVAIVVFAILFIFKLSSQKKVVVRYAKIYLFLCISQGGYAFFLALLSNSLGGSDGGDVESQLMGIGFRNALYGLVWLLYFYNSKRVKNTFTK